MRTHPLLFSLVLVLSADFAVAGEAKLEFVLQAGHAGGVTSLALSPDGKHLLTTSGYSPAILWEVATGRILRTFNGPTMAMSRDGRFLLEEDGQARILWDTISGKKIQTFQFPTGSYATETRCAAVSRDGKRLVIGHWDWDRTVAVWDTATGKKIQTLKRAPEFFTNLALSDDGKIVLSTKSTGSAIRWDADSGEMLRGLALMHQGPLSFPRSPQPPPQSFVFALSGDGARVLYGSGDGTAGISAVEAGKPAQVFKGHTGMVRCVAMSDDGKFLATGASLTRLTFVEGAKEDNTARKEDNTAILWDAVSGTKLQTFDVGDGGVGSVAFSADNKYLVTGSSTQAVLWEVASGKKIRTFQGHLAAFQQMAESRDGKRVVTTLSGAKLTAQTNATILWEPTGPRKIDLGNVPNYAGLALSGDGTFLLTNGSLWDIAAGKQLRSFGGDTAMSDDGKVVVSHAHDGKETDILDAVSGKKVRLFHHNAGAPGHLSQIAFVSTFSLSADGRSLVTGSSDGKTAVLWDTASGKKLKSFTVFDKEIRGVAVSGDGKRVVTRTTLFEATTVIVWDAATGRRIVTFEVGPYASCGLSGGGKHILTVENHGMSVTVWEAASGKKVQTLHGHTNRIVGVALNGDGNLWTASQDGTMRLWDLSGKERCRLYSFDAGKDWLVVTPDGLFDGSPGARRFVAYREPGTVKLLDEEATRSRFHRPGLLAQVWNGKIAEGGWSANSKDSGNGRKFLDDDGQIGTIRRLVLSADRATMVTDGTDQIIRFWDAKTGKLLRRLDGISEMYGQLLSLSPDGKSFLTTPNIVPLRPILFDGLILWDAATAREIRHFQLTVSDDDAKKGMRKGTPIDGVFSHDGKSLAVASEYNLHYHFFDLASGKESRRVCWCPGDGLSAVPALCRWSPDGRHFAGKYSPKPKEKPADFAVALWDMSKPEPQVVSEVGTFFRDMAFSADGDYFAWSDDRKLTHLWDVRANRKIKSFETESWGQLAFSPDDRYLAAGKTLHPLSARDPALQLPFEPRFPAFSQDSQKLFVVSPENDVLLYDVNKLERAK